MCVSAMALLHGVVAGQSGKAAASLTLESLFAKDRVVDVQITVTKQDWRQLRMQSRTFQQALGGDRKRGKFIKTYTYVDADVTIDGVVLQRVGIRKKGFLGSQSTVRPSLKIKLNHSDPAGGIEGLSNLTFNNNQQDESLVSQFLGYGLFNAAGSPAPRCGFARVTVNGKYLGVYSHVESMRAPLLDREFGSAAGTLYEGTVVDFLEGWGKGFERKSGKRRRGRARIDALIAVLADTADDDLERAVSEIVELDAFLTFWALEGLLGFWDGYTGNKNNYFFYVHPKTQQMHFMPWGGDMMFMKYNPMERYPDEPISVKTRAMLPHRLYQIESVRRRYRSTMQRLLKDHWNEQALLAETDRIEAMLEPHLGKSQRRAFDRLDDLRDFITERRAEIIAEIDGGMPLWNKQPKPPFVMPGEGEPADLGDSIWSAARDGDLDRLARHAADVNATSSEDGSHPLALAVVAGRIEAVRLLLTKGAVVDAKNARGEVALHAAAFFGQVEIAQLLIDAGADLDVVAADGSSPLARASADWNEETAGIAKMVGSFLGIEYDLKQIEARRPKVAALLQEHGARR